MSLTRLPVTQPVASVVFGLLLVALGIGAITRMPVREYPDVDPPIVSVGVVYPGASAEVVERDVVQPIEDNLSGIDGVELITSTSRAGFAQVDVEFLLRRDLDAAQHPAARRPLLAGGRSARCRRVAGGLPLRRQAGRPLSA